MEGFKKNINRSIESYLRGDYQKFKQYERTNFLLKHINKAIDKKTHYKLLDLGCSKGEMIYLLKESFENIDFTGIDISEDLLDIAKKEIFLKSVKFIQDDISTFSLKENFDIVLMSGVISIFDDYEKILLNVLNHMKKGSVGFIFGAFNQDDIDVLIRYKNNYVGSNEWESGWNLFSLKRINQFLEYHSKSVEIIKFNLNKKMKKKKNPVSSYTLELQNNSNLIVTGGGVIRDFYLIKFIKK